MLVGKFASLGLGIEDHDAIIIAWGRRTDRLSRLAIAKFNNGSSVL
jgi:hypothetical protein